MVGGFTGVDPDRTAPPRRPRRGVSATVHRTERRIDYPRFRAEARLGGRIRRIPEAVSRATDSERLAFTETHARGGPLLRMGRRRQEIPQEVNHFKSSIDFDDVSPSIDNR